MCGDEECGTSANVSCSVEEEEEEEEEGADAPPGRLNARLDQPDCDAPVPLHPSPF